MKKILWVDDEISSLKAITITLKKKGIGTIRAHSKAEAIKKLSLEHDLLLLDLIIPQENQEMFDNCPGLSLLRQLMFRGYTKPIIVFTITKNAELEMELKNYNVLYLYKGSTSTIDLINEIEKLI